MDPQGLSPQLCTQGPACHLPRHRPRRANTCPRRPGARTQVREPDAILSAELSEGPCSGRWWWKRLSRLNLKQVTRILHVGWVG